MRFTLVKKTYVIIHLNFPEIEWKEEWFVSSIPQSFWRSLSNQRDFMERVKKSLGVQEPRDWGRVTTRVLEQLGGSSLLSAYQGSVLNILKTVYTGEFSEKFQVKMLQRLIGSKVGLRIFQNSRKVIGNLRPIKRSSWIILLRCMGSINRLTG